MEWTSRGKMLLSAGLTAAAAALALTARKPWSAFAALAMAVSTVGDGILAGYPPFLRLRKNSLVTGGIVFLAAHGLYMAALYIASGKNAAALMPYFGITAPVFALLTVLQACLWRSRANSSVSGALWAAAAGYLLIAGLHAALAFCICAGTGGRMALNTAGAALFFLSDSVLLSARFGIVGQKTARLLIWPTYAAAQICLMTGFFLA